MQNKSLYIIVSVISIFWSSFFGQVKAQYFMGYPSYLDSINDSAKIILDKIPGYGERRFNAETIHYFEIMCQFMESHPEYKCNIYLYDFEPTSFEKRLTWTTLQAQKLKSFLLANDTLCDFTFINNIIPNGEENPVFKDLKPSDTSDCLSKQYWSIIKQSIVLELLRNR